jgi:type I restriction enzyme S subunit
LPLPDHGEQLAIAHILGTLDDKIELNRRTSETLEAMAQVLFKDWFIDFGPVRAKMEGREPSLNSAVWDLLPDKLAGDGGPQGWRWGPVSDWITFNPPETLRKGDVAPYLDMAALPTQGSTPEAPIQREFGSGMKFRNGDTLLARITPCLENGKTAFIQLLPEEAIAWGSTEFIVMRPRAPVPGPYAYALARDPSFRQHAIRSMSGTSGRQRVQADSVAAYSVCLPMEAPLWTAFSDIVQPMFDGIQSNAEETGVLTTLRDALLPKLISGELRIQDAERFLAGVAA